MASIRGSIQATKYFRPFSRSTHLPNVSRHAAIQAHRRGIATSHEQIQHVRRPFKVGLKVLMSFRIFKHPSKRQIPQYGTLYNGYVRSELEESTWLMLHRKKYDNNTS
jgi:hypothetical protein